jgi:hypothetical protein
MVRSIACLSVSFSLWLTMAGPAAGQAAVEYGLGAARAATTVAPAKGAGQVIGGLAGSLEKAVKAGQQRSDAQPAATTTAKPAVEKSSSAAKTESPLAHISPPPAPNWEDPSGIQTGLSYQELIRRFGPPALEITGERGRSLAYSGKNGVFQLQVQDDKVTSIEKPKS